MAFLSTLSLRRATYPESAPCEAPTFLSTLSLRRATVGTSQVFQRIAISIHALLAESDCDCSFFPSPQVISIHALLAESDYLLLLRGIGQPLFLSTLSLRRATFVARVSTLSLRRATLNQIPPRHFHYHFYPRSPCGERPEAIKPS